MTSIPDILSVVLRAIAFCLLFQAAGVGLFLAVFRAGLKDSLPDIRRAALVAAAAALIVLTAHFLLEAARMAGDFSGAMNVALQRTALRSATGAAFGLRVAGLLLVGFAAKRPSERFRLAGPLGALLAAASFIITGHTSVHSYRPVLAAMLMIHVLAGMFWFGSLWPLHLAVRREARERAGRTIAAFSFVAGWSVPLIFAAGVVMTAILVPDLATFAKPYGVLLITKALLFAALMGLAAANRWRFGPGMASGHPRVARQFQAAVATEIVLICAVLAVTACLTTFFSPDA